MDYFQSFTEGGIKMLELCHIRVHEDMSVSLVCHVLEYADSPDFHLSFNLANGEVLTPLEESQRHYAKAAAEHLRELFRRHKKLPEHTLTAWF